MVFFMGKAELIAEELRNGIISGKYACGSKFPSEYELALLFEVNSKTANKAVSLLVSEGFLERGGRGQGTRVRKKLTGLLHAEPVVFIGSINNEYYARVLNGIQEKALSENIPTIYLSPRPEELHKVIEELTDAPICGIITHGYGRIQCGNVPVIYIDKLPDNDSCHIVTGSNYQAGCEAVNVLYELGHRRIAGFFSERLMPGRMQGVVDTLNARGIKDNEKFIYCSRSFNSYDARIFLENMQKCRCDFTAVIAGSDGMLIHLMRLLEAQNDPWRHNLAMIGFGNLHEAEHLNNMASFDQHPNRLGIKAFEKLWELKNTPDASGFIYEEIPMELVRTGSLPKCNLS